MEVLQPNHAMGIVAALLRSPEQLHRLRAAIRGRYPVSPCDGWDAVRRLFSELDHVPNIQIAGMVVNGVPPRAYRSRAYGYYYHS